MAPCHPDQDRGGERGSRLQPVEPAFPEWARSARCSLGWQNPRHPNSSENAPTGTAVSQLSKNLGSVVVGRASSEIENR